MVFHFSNVRIRYKKIPLKIKVDIVTSGDNAVDCSPSSYFTDLNHVI